MLFQKTKNTENLAFPYSYRRQSLESYFLFSRIKIKKELEKRQNIEYFSHRKNKNKKSLPPFLCSGRIRFYRKEGMPDLPLIRDQNKNPIQKPTEWFHLEFIKCNDWK